MGQVGAPGLVAGFGQVAVVAVVDDVGVDGRGVHDYRHHPSLQALGQGQAPAFEADGGHQQYVGLPVVRFGVLQSFERDALEGVALGVVFVAVEVGTGADYHEPPVFGRGMVLDAFPGLEREGDAFLVFVHARADKDDVFFFGEYGVGADVVEGEGVVDGRQAVVVGAAGHFFDEGEVGLGEGDEPVGVVVDPVEGLAGLPVAFVAVVGIEEKGFGEGDVVGGAFVALGFVEVVERHGARIEVEA